MIVNMKKEPSARSVTGEGELKENYEVCDAKVSETATARWEMI
jgi:hypothetical protein